MPGHNLKGYREVEQLARSFGLSVERTKIGHIKATAPDGRVAFVCVPTDKRGRLNTETRLRKIASA